MSKVTLMHLSDLHKSILAYDSSKALVSSIVSDIARYPKDEIAISRPDTLIVCGDVVRGSESSMDEIDKQYAEAGDFLNRLCKDVFAGDKSNIVIVPGNHDVSWPHSKNSMRKIESLDGVLAELIRDPRSNVRWNWKNCSYYKISDLNIYNQRFLPFSKFYSSFYDNQRKYSLSPEEQFDIFEFPEQKLLLVGFNSCFCNDHLNHIGMINPECIANCHSYVRKEKYEHWTKIAVWHHGIHGIPTENDYMDERTVQFLIDKGFMIGLHGHQHKSDFFNVRFSADHKQKMLIFSCGTLCAPKEDLPLGETRQYSIIELDGSCSKIRFHVRKGVDQPPSLPIWMPGNVRQNYDRSCMDIDMQIAPIRKSKEGKEDMVEKSRSLKELGLVEDLVAKREYSGALKKLMKMDKNDPFVRRLTVECLFQLEMDDEIVQYIEKPLTPTEFTYLCEALWRKKGFLALRKLVDDSRQYNDIAESEQFRRIDSKLKDKGY